MRRLPGPASCPLCDGVKTPEAPVELFRGWQRTQTQSSVRTLRSLRQQMDVWFCWKQESSAERRCCVTADSDKFNCAPSGARLANLCLSLDLDLHRGGQLGHYEELHNSELPEASASRGCISAAGKLTVLLDDQSQLLRCVRTADGSGDDQLIGAWCHVL